MSEETTPLLIGGLLLLLGVTAAVVILEAIGKTDSKAETSAKLRTVHKVVVWIFFALFLALAAGMHSRLKYWLGEPPSRVMFHWVLSLVVIASITAKVLINRRYKKLGTYLPALGWTIVISTFILLIVSGGFNLIRLTGAANIDPGSGYTHTLVEMKCGHCHSLERVYKLPQNEELIESTVGRMRTYSPDWISDAEAEAIIQHLSNRMERH